MDYWQKQTSDKPLFPDLLWSKPENKKSAGKILIIGGHAGSFSLPAGAYQSVVEAGAGQVRVLMPDSLRKTTDFLPDISYAPATQSGSFAKTALAEMLDYAQWADADLLAGQLGKSAETTATIDRFLQENKKPIAISDQALESIGLPTTDLLAKGNITLVLAADSLRKFGIDIKLQKAITSETGLVELVDILHQVSTDYPASLICEHSQSLIVASHGKISTTPVKNRLDINKIGAFATVWLAQNPKETFGALSCAAYELSQ